MAMQLLDPGAFVLGHHLAQLHLQLLVQEQSQDQAAAREEFLEQHGAEVSLEPDVWAVVHREC
jgi:hypothetical protein